MTLVTTPPNQEEFTGAKAISNAGVKTGAEGGGEPPWYQVPRDIESDYCHAISIYCGAPSEG